MLAYRSQAVEQYIHTCGIYHTAAAGQCGHHAKGCSLTPHVLRGTPRLSVRAIVCAQASLPLVFVVVVVRERGLLLFWCWCWRLRPWQHPASLRPHALTVSSKVNCTAASLLSLVFVQATTIVYLPDFLNYIATSKRRLHLAVCCLSACLLACLSALPPCARQSCLRPGCISIPHQHHPPLTTPITPASLPERA